MNDTALIPSPPGRAARGAFTGEKRDFFRLVRRGALLELVTAGFYRFWLATNIRRALWSGTVLEGDPGEYTGTAKELLIGFLFALAILVPIYLIYFLIGVEAERAKAFASIPLVLFFYAFGQFAIFRARRYRATRTVWRGVRFWMTGSGMDYSGRACLWGLLVIVTLGLALPWRDSALERYKMRHLHYGDLPGRFDATGWQLFKRGWLLWLLCLCTIPLFAWLSYIRPRPGFIVLFMLCVTVAWPFAYSFYKSITWRWWLRGIRFGEVSFDSDLSLGALVGLYWAVIGWCLLLLIVDMVLIALIAGLARISGVQFSAQALALLFGQHPYLFFGTYLLNYLVLALCANVVLRVYLIRGVWERVVTSVTVHNLELADDVQVRGDLVSALGEGFADGLDVAGFSAEPGGGSTAGDGTTGNTAIYFDGVTNRRRVVTLTFDVVLQISENGVGIASWHYDDLRAVDGGTILRLKCTSALPLARLNVADAAAQAEIRARAHFLDVERDTGAHTARIVAWSIAAIVSIAATIFFGVPFVATQMVPLIPPSFERRLGDMADNQVRVLFGREPCSGAQGNAALAKLVETLRRAGHLDAQLQPAVLPSALPNAFALPGGKIYILNGLLQKADNPDEVAGVVAHEMGHVIHRDQTRMIIENGGTSFLVGLLFGDITGSGAAIFATRSLFQASYSRGAEANADAFAIDTMHALGRSPAPMGELLFRITGAQGARTIGILASHPLTEERRELMRREDRPATGPEILSGAEWAALKAVCRPATSK